MISEMIDHHRRKIEMTQDTNTTPQGQVPEAIAGALFDFAGFLTTLPKERAVTLSGVHLATPVVDLLTEWAETRGLNLDEAYMEMFFDKTSGRWVFNDVPNDIIAAVPGYAGLVAYLVEF